MRKFAQLNKYVVKYSAAAVCILLLIMWLLPAGYNSYSSDSVTTKFWVLASLSCNPFGVIISLFVILAILIFSTRKFIRVYQSVIIFFLIGVMIVSTGVYLINFIKAKYPEARPYQEFLSSQKVLPEQLEEFKKLTDTQRRIILANDSLLNKMPVGVNPIVYKIWLQEPALSFPSAHAFNSAFIGTVYSCILFFTITNKKLRYFYLAPLVWMIFVSLSRVMLGFHYRTDVAFGAVMGYCVALIFIYAGALNKIIFLNREPKNI
ncbi:MAG: phosphatase PAP2 family protein [Bacteroidetes bacterium]|nr:phosphatase PAP2 family protein [Bacteroidota bacterium]